MSEIRVDTISEKTSANGVAVDGVTIKDGGITVTGAAILNGGIDIVGNLTIDVDGSTITLADGGVNFGQFYNNASGTFNIVSPTQDKDIVFRGNDGGTGIVALTLDISNAGAAAFNAGATFNDKVGIGTAAPTQKIEINVSGTSAIPTNEAIGSSNADVANGLGIHNASDSGVYSGIALETRTSGASRWLIANEWQSTYNGDLVFRARNGASSSTEVMRLTSGGIAIGGTGAANTLDDYEEGTWTPVIKSHANTISVSGGNSSFTYTKIGRQVTVHFAIQGGTLSGTINNAGDFTRIQGLPFTTSSTAGQRYVSTQFMYYSGGSQFEEENITCNVGTNSNFIEVHEHDGAGTGYSSARLKNVTSGTYWMFQMTYFV